VEHGRRGRVGQRFRGALGTSNQRQLVHCHRDSVTAIP
jgi:hypothetical protein